MHWRELITGIYAARKQQPGIAGKPSFYSADSAGDVSDAELRLKATFPDSLRSLLRETNGVMDMMAVDGGDWFDSMWLLWTVAEIVEQNLFYRTAHDDGKYDRDFRRVVFFAGAGADGILFGFPVMQDGACAARVVVWHPIEDELDECAPSLESFLKGWLTGAITV